MSERSPTPMVERVARAICRAAGDDPDAEARDAQDPANDGALRWEQWVDEASAAIAAAFDWRPISTAPRDGSEIIAGCADIADGFQQIVFWEDDGNYHGWGVKDSPTICPMRFFSHWMPLPPTPAQSGA